MNIIAVFIIRLTNLRLSIAFKNSSMSLFVILEATVYIWLYYDALMCRHIMCNSSDLAPECPNPHDSRYYPERILLYDQHPGGLGVSVQVSHMKLENWIMKCDTFNVGWVCIPSKCSNLWLIYVPRFKETSRLYWKYLIEQPWHIGPLDP